MGRKTLDRHPQTKPGACCVCRVQICCVRHLLGVSLQALSSPSPFFLPSHLWCRGWVSTNLISEALWPAPLWEVLPLGGTRGRPRGGLRANDLPGLCSSCSITPAVMTAPSSQLSQHMENLPPRAPSQTWPAAGRWLGGLSADSLEPLLSVLRSGRLS